MLTKNCQVPIAAICGTHECPKSKEDKDILSFSFCPAIFVFDHPNILYRAAPNSNFNVQFALSFAERDLEFGWYI